MEVMLSLCGWLQTEPVAAIELAPCRLAVLEARLADYSIRPADLGDGERVGLKL